MKTFLLVLRIINACFTLYRNLKKHAVLTAINKKLTKGANHLHRQLNTPRAFITKGLSVTITPGFVLQTCMSVNILAGRITLYFYSVLSCLHLVLSGVPLYTALSGSALIFLFGKIGFDFFDRMNK